MSIVQLAARLASVAPELFCVRCRLAPPHLDLSVEVSVELVIG